MKSIFILAIAIISTIIFGCDYKYEQSINREIDSLQTIYDSLDLANDEFTECCDSNENCCNRKKHRALLELKLKVSTEKYNAVLRKYETRRALWSGKEDKKKGLKKICCD